MIIDRAASTVTFGGRTFPACVLVCPPYGDEDTTEHQRLLGGQGGPGLANLAISNNVYIPCENGLLIEVEQTEDHYGYEVTLRCPTCRPVRSDAETILIPETVGIVGHYLYSEPRSVNQGTWHWRNGEAEWVAELIDRLSKLAFEIPEGPRVALRPLSFAYAP